MSDDEFEQSTGGDEDLFEGLHRSVAGATMTTGVADVVALGRRTRNRHRALAAGIGTSAVAVVAAIGMLAPSAGSGGGSAPGTAAQGANPGRQQPATPGTTSGGARTLSIQDAGFTLEKKANGTVELTFEEVFNPDKLQAALGRAGIPADIQRTAVPDRDTEGFPTCEPTPGVTVDKAADQAVLKQLNPKGGGKLVLNAARFPAGDVVSLSWFTYSTGARQGTFSILTGKPQKCVLVWNPATPGHK